MPGICESSSTSQPLRAGGEGWQNRPSCRPGAIGLRRVWSRQKDSAGYTSRQRGTWLPRLVAATLLLAFLTHFRGAATTFSHEMQTLCSMGMLAMEESPLHVENIHTGRLLIVDFPLIVDFQPRILERLGHRCNSCYMHVYTIKMLPRTWRYAQARPLGVEVSQPTRKRSCSGRPVACSHLSTVSSCEPQGGRDEINSRVHPATPPHPPHPLTCPHVECHLRTRNPPAWGFK